MHFPWPQCPPLSDCMFFYDSRYPPCVALSSQRQHTGRNRSLTFGQAERGRSGAGQVVQVQLQPHRVYLRHGRAEVGGQLGRRQSAALHRERTHGHQHTARRRTEQVRPNTLYGGEQSSWSGPAHCTEENRAGLAQHTARRGTEQVRPSTLHGGEQSRSGPAHCTEGNGAGQAQHTVRRVTEQVRPHCTEGNGGGQAQHTARRGTEQDRPSTLYGGERSRSGPAHCTEGNRAGQAQHTARR